MKIKLLVLMACLSTILIAQKFENIQLNNFKANTPQISSGAENALMIEKMKQNGTLPVVSKNADVKSKIQTNNTNSILNSSSLFTVEAMNFDLDASFNGGYYHIPPDPSGAIGENHLVSVTNTSIEWFTKNGANLSSQALSTFFASLSPATGTFDPKVLYDQYEDRFVVVTLERTHSATDSTSKIFIAVSATSDPTGTWYFYSINSKINVSGVEYWADYPGFAIGENAIYVTCNLFHFTTGAYGGGRLWVVDKGVSSGFYSGGAGSVAVSNPFSTGGYSLTLQPAHMFGTSPSGVGTYLVGYSRLSDGTYSYLEIFSVSNSTSSPVITFGGYVNFGAVDDYSIFPYAPQLGSSYLISTNDPRTFNAVWRNNSLYTCTVVVPPSGDLDAGQVTAHWIKVNTTGFSIIDQGNIGAEDLGAGTYTFFPSISVNALGEMLVGFAASGPSIYPGAYYAFRYPYDTPGTVQATQTLKAGEDYYVRTFTAGSTGRNRWGDYSGSSVDPTNDITFCLFNEYAMTRGTLLGGEDGRWATVFGILPRLQLKVLLEGPWNGTDMNYNLVSDPSFPLNQPFNTTPWNYEGLEAVSSTISAAPAVDWVLLTLRKDLNPSSPDPTTSIKVASRAAILDKDGNIFDVAGNTINLDVAFTVEPGNYYLEIQQRNHLSVMSPVKISLN